MVAQGAGPLAGAAAAVGLAAELAVAVRGAGRRALAGEAVALEARVAADARALLEDALTGPRAAAAVDAFLVGQGAGPLADAALVTAIGLAAELARAVGDADLDALAVHAGVFGAAAGAAALLVLAVALRRGVADAVEAAVAAVHEGGAAHEVGAALPALGLAGLDLAARVVEADVVHGAALVHAVLTAADADELVVADLVDLGAAAVAEPAAAVGLAAGLVHAVRRAVGAVEAAGARRVLGALEVRGAAVAVAEVGVAGAAGLGAGLVGVGAGHDAGRAAAVVLAAGLARAADAAADALRVDADLVVEGAAADAGLAAAVVLAAVQAVAGPFADLLHVGDGHEVRRGVQEGGLDEGRGLEDLAVGTEEVEDHDDPDLPAVGLLLHEAADRGDVLAAARRVEEGDRAALRHHLAVREDDGVDVGRGGQLHPHVEVLVHGELIPVRDDHLDLGLAREARGGHDDLHEVHQAGEVAGGVERVVGRDDPVGEEIRLDHLGRVRDHQGRLDDDLLHEEHVRDGELLVVVRITPDPARGRIELARAGHDGPGSVRADHRSAGVDDADHGAADGGDQRSIALEGLEGDHRHLHAAAGDR